jgi:hypothetical protein
MEECGISRGEPVEVLLGHANVSWAGRTNPQGTWAGRGHFPLLIMPGMRAAR